MGFFRILLVSLLTLPQLALAATPGELDRLYTALRGTDLMEILSEEGRVQSEELQADMFPGRSNASWVATSSAIYDVEKMRVTFRARFNAELTDTDVSEILDYLESDEGKRVVNLEVDARRALMDDAVEEAAREAFGELKIADEARLDRLEAFVDANNLIDLNVSGALNSNLSFYNGLAAGGGFELPQDEILADIWESADEIRADATEWMFGYLTMAYEPLEDQALDTYISLSETPSGKALNRALFAAFDDLFRGISFDLGKAASRFTQGDDI
ncbi:MAG: DUF2059 domain-containing protein [Paracoccaceae bacterium]